MKLSPQLKRRLRWQNRIFIILLFSLVTALGWLSINYHVYFDLTQSQSNHPSDETTRLLKAIEEPINVKAFISPDNAISSNQVRALIKKYQRVKPDIKLEIIDPVREPQIVRENNIRGEGELIVTIADKSEKVIAATEEKLTNALNHLARTSQDWILFLQGHNERSPFGDTSFDYSAWRKVLKSNGLNVRNYNLADNAQIPENTQLLVIADPQKQYLKGEVNILLDYIEHGGNLLWLVEPGDSFGLEALAEAIGVEIIPGVIVDPNSQVVGINDPRFTLITEYPSNKITEDLTSVSIFPTAAPLEFYANEEWNSEILLETLPRTWATESDINEISVDSPPSINGPLTIGISLMRDSAGNMEMLEDFISDEAFSDSELSLEQGSKEQRIVIIGDSDFPSDAYLGEAGNLDIAMNIISWLIQSENFIDVTPKEKLDRHIELSKTMQIIIGFGFLVVLPLGLLISGFLIWRKRRNI